MATKRKVIPKGNRFKDLEELKKVCTGRMMDCFITLNGGARSSKDIEYLPKSNSFHIHHQIDGESETLTEKEFINSFTGKALTLGALYSYI